MLILYHMECERLLCVMGGCYSLKGTNSRKSHLSFENREEAVGADMICNSTFKVNLCRV